MFNSTTPPVAPPTFQQTQAILDHVLDITSTGSNANSITCTLDPTDEAVKNPIRIIQGLAEEVLLSSKFRLLVLSFFLKKIKFITTAM